MTLNLVQINSASKNSKSGPYVINYAKKYIYLKLLLDTSTEC